MTAFVEKDPDETREFYVEFLEEILQEAERGAYFASGVVVYYPRDLAWLYEVTTAGRLSSHYPHQLPRAAGETHQDGSAVLTCRHPDDVSTTPEVSSAVWTPASGITQVSDRVSAIEGRAYITVSGGADGVDYEALCRMTPTVGNVIEKTLTIQVRAQ